MEAPRPQEAQAQSPGKRTTSRRRARGSPYGRPGWPKEKPRTSGASRANPARRNAPPVVEHRVWFWAFHPNLAIVPSLPLLFVLPVIVRPDTARLGWPLMPSCFLVLALAAWLTRMARSGICSMRPAPKTGVGILKMRLLLAAAPTKSGWARTHPAAPVRPVMVAVLCTPPGPVCVELEPGFAHRAGLGDEGWDAIGSALLRGECHLRESWTEDG
jgi:hypothetical protein